MASEMAYSASLRFVAADSMVMQGLEDVDEILDGDLDVAGATDGLGTSESIVCVLVLVMPGAVLIFAGESPTSSKSSSSSSSSSLTQNFRLVAVWTVLRLGEGGVRCAWCGCCCCGWLRELWRWMWCGLDDGGDEGGVDGRS